MIGSQGVLMGLAPGAFGQTGAEEGLDLLPFSQERPGYERLDQFADGAGVGVVSAQRGSGAGVKAPFKEGAEDGGVNGPPVHVSSGGIKRSQVGGGQIGDVDDSEEAAVEPGDVVVTVFPAGLLLHGAEQRSEPAGGLAGINPGALQESGEDLAGEQLFVLGEHAEEALHQKMCYPLAVKPTVPHGFSEPGKMPGGLASYGGKGFLRTELFRIGKDPAQQLPFGGVGQLRDADFAGFIGIAGEGGMDDDPFPVADHQKRRVVQMEGIIGKLLEGGVQVGPGFLFSQPKQPRFQTSAQPSAELDFFAPRSEQ